MFSLQLLLLSTVHIITNLRYLIYNECFGEHILTGNFIKFIHARIIPFDSLPIDRNNLLELIDATKDMLKFCTNFKYYPQ